VTFRLKFPPVRARAPGDIRWQLAGKTIGTGSDVLRVAPGTTAISAVDKRRGGRSLVPVLDGVVDYGALPHGKLHPRANPYADVYLGGVPLGTTPFPPVEVAVGSYELRFIHAGKEERRVVEVSQDGITRVSVKFED
jgi:hypothetical protein